MPAKSSWLLGIPEIVARLSAMQSPVVDRSTVEQLFGVRRRRASDLVQSFGGYRVGNAVLVDRDKLIRQLEELSNDPEVLREQHRKLRISEELEKVAQQSRAARIVIGNIRHVPHETAWTLPRGVSIAGGRLIVEFDCVQELLMQLYKLVLAAAADFERFSDVASRTSE